MKKTIFQVTTALAIARIGHEVYGEIAPRERMRQRLGREEMASRAARGDEDERMLGQAAPLTRLAGRAARQDPARGPTSRRAGAGA